VQPGMGFNNLMMNGKLQADVAFAQSKRPESQLIVLKKLSFFRTSLEIKTLAGLSASYNKYVSLSRRLTTLEL
jgi:hypothetical protein